MIEEKIREYLTTELIIPIVFEVPKEIPNEYVLMQVVDAGVVNHINAITITFYCRSDSLYKSARLSREISLLLDRIIELDYISKAEMGGLASDIDTKTKTYQYILNYNFYYFKED